MSTEQESLEPTSGLSSAEKKVLRGQAMSLKPLIQIGKAGISPAVISAMEKALIEKHLVKVRILHDDRNQRAEWAKELSQECPSEITGQVGKTYSFYRQPSATSNQQPATSNQQLATSS